MLVFVCVCVSVCLCVCVSGPPPFKLPEDTAGIAAAGVPRAESVAARHTPVGPANATATATVTANATAGISAYTVEQVHAWVMEVAGISSASADKLRLQEVNGRALLRLTAEKLVGGAYQLPAGAAENIMEAVERYRG